MTATQQRQTSGPLRMRLVDVLQHGLRTPLTAVLAHAELLQELDLVPSARMSVESILRAAERIQELATTLTAIGAASLTPTGQAWPVGDVVPRQCDLVLLVRDVVSARSAGLRQGDSSLLVTEPAAGAVAFVDEQAPRGALSTLLDLAADRAVGGTSGL